MQKMTDVEPLLRESRYPMAGGDKPPVPWWASLLVLVAVAVAAALWLWLRHDNAEAEARRLRTVLAIRSVGLENAVLASEAASLTEKMGVEDPRPLPDPIPRVSDTNGSSSVAPHPENVSRGAREGSGWSKARVSVYGEGDGLMGNRTANGDTLDATTPTFAHRSMPFGTRVTFRYGGRSVTAVCNDRGPFVGERTFDLAPATRKALGLGITVATVEWRHE